MSHTLFHDWMVTFYVDLDNTMIYSYKHEIGPKKRCAERYQGREISFLTEKTWRGLLLIAKLAIVVPVTTRTLEQYHRIRLDIGELPYVLACNGGVLLKNGREDAEWYEASRKLVQESRGEMEQARALLAKDSSVCFEIRWVRELFVFTKSREPEKTVKFLTDSLDLTLVEVFRNGMKVYVVPKALHKGAAVRRLQERLRREEVLASGYGKEPGREGAWISGCGSGLRKETKGFRGERVIAAGDSVFDLPMLEQAELAIAPEGLLAGFREEWEKEWKEGSDQPAGRRGIRAEGTLPAPGPVRGGKRRLVEIPSEVLFSEGVVNRVLTELLVRVAKRENNQKRPYLVVNPLQAKHVPADPRKTLAMFDALAKLLASEYEGEKLLLIGFAETATAIGARLAIDLGCAYLQTTREYIKQAEYLYFTESHSHATEQRLVKTGLLQGIEETDRVIFVEDEITTGNTIAKLVDLLRRTYREDLKCSVASLLNGMDKEAALRYQERKISVHYLVKTDHSKFTEIAEGFAGDGQYKAPYFQGISEKKGPMEEKKAPAEWKKDENNNTYICHVTILGAVNARKITSGLEYQNACGRLWEQVETLVQGEQGETVLVLGTEECMYPAIVTAKKLAESGCRVKCHATTRSPIAVSREAEYPLHCRYELQSFYERGRRTFVYDLARYDKVLVITDAAAGESYEAGMDTLCHALAASGNERIYIIRWCES